MNSGDPRGGKPNIQQSAKGQLESCRQELHYSGNMFLKPIYPGKSWIKLVCHASVASVVCDLSGSS